MVSGGVVLERERENERVRERKSSLDTVGVLAKSADSRYARFVGKERRKGRGAGERREREQKSERDDRRERRWRFTNTSNRNTGDGSPRYTRALCKRARVCVYVVRIRRGGEAVHLAARRGRMESWRANEGGYGVKAGGAWLVEGGRGEGGKMGVFGWPNPGGLGRQGEVPGGDRG